MSSWGGPTLKKNLCLDLTPSLYMRFNKWSKHNSKSKERGHFWRNVNMTDSRWPNEYDRKNWTWPKTDNDENSLDELDQNLIFGQVQSSIFVVVVIFFIFFTFWSNSIILGQVQQVNVCRCHFRSCSNHFLVILIRSRELASTFGFFNVLYEFCYFILDYIENSWQKLCSK